MVLVSVVHRRAVTLAIFTILGAPGCGSEGAGGGGTSGSSGSAATSGADNATDTAPVATSIAGLCESGDDGWVSATSPGGGNSGGSSGGAEDTGFGMDDDMPLLTTIYEINGGNIPTGELVEVRAVIVTSPVYPSESGAQLEFFVQEPDSGPLSGIRVRTNFTLSQTPVPGDILTIEGQLRGQASHQVIHTSWGVPLAFTGTADVPEPVIITTQDLDDPNSELAVAYEGVVVRVESVVVTHSDPCVGEFEVDTSVRIDDRFLLDAMPTPANGEAFASVAGPLIYVSDDEYEGMEIAPRAGNDVSP
ncbi:MAG: hypothetical protein K0V04_45075 [Deltaproteobacteria bacterium]|nr:hypothetical protein [Deltaproteobacteria bacterium]